MHLSIIFLLHHFQLKEEIRPHVFVTFFQSTIEHISPIAYSCTHIFFMERPSYHHFPGAGHLPWFKDFLFPLKTDPVHNLNVSCGAWCIKANSGNTWLARFKLWMLRTSCNTWARHLSFSFLIRTWKCYQLLHHGAVTESSVRSSVSSIQGRAWLSCYRCSIKPTITQTSQAWGWRHQAENASKAGIQPGDRRGLDRETQLPWNEGRKWTKGDGPVRCPDHRVVVVKHPGEIPLLVFARSMWRLEGGLAGRQVWVHVAVLALTYKVCLELFGFEQYLLERKNNTQREGEGDGERVTSHHSPNGSNSQGLDQAKARRQEPHPSLLEC